MLAINALGDRLHQCGGRECVALVEPEERYNPERMLKLWNIDIEVHPVDTLDFERHVLAQDLSYAAC
jgi:hypothetical protein